MAAEEAATALATVRYWAAAKEVAGTASEQYRAGTLGELLDAVRSRHADRPRFAAVLAMSSLLVDGDPVGARDPRTVRLAEGAAVEVLPPFAGG